GLAAMVVESVSKCDADVRPQFCSNILLTGGSTLIPGFTERLQAEVTTALPGLRVKVQASGNTAERQFGSWIGASMVSSLGTFHQLWVSKQEYEEQGSSIIAKK
ncbi:Actin/actin-like protein, partial [Ramicandelaber brevisporus]